MQRANRRIMAQRESMQLCLFCRKKIRAELARIKRDKRMFFVLPHSLRTCAITWTSKRKPCSVVYIATTANSGVRSIPPLRALTARRERFRNCNCEKGSLFQSKQSFSGNKESGASRQNEKHADQQASNERTRKVASKESPRSSIYN